MFGISRLFKCMISLNRMRTRIGGSAANVGRPGRFRFPKSCKFLCGEKNKVSLCRSASTLSSTFCSISNKGFCYVNQTAGKFFSGCLIYTIVLFIVSEILFLTGFFRLPVLLELSMNGSRQTRSIPSCSSSR